MRRPVVAVHQPNYLPWLGWFAKAAQADVFVLLDDVQFEKGGYTHRVEVKTTAGRTRLTVPVGARGFPRIDEIRIASDPRWRVRHVRTLEQSYGRSPGWARFGLVLVDAIHSPEARLAALNERLIRLLLPAYGIACRVVRASELRGRAERGSAGLVEICRLLGAGTYLSGSGARTYNDPASFEQAGVDLLYSSFEHPVYAQPHGAFEAGLSAIDLLFSAPSEARWLLRSGVNAPVR